MAGIIHGLSWFPNCSQRFVTWGQEINVFEAKPKSGNESTQHSRNPLTLSANLEASFLVSENRYQYIRCLKPSFHSETIVAVGLASGKIGICNFDPNIDNNLEFTPRQQRTCSCLAWNENEKNILAIGHDRNRSDYCITIWDVERGLPKETSNFIGLSETAHSLCWDKQHRVLIAGMSQKNIKIFDLRQNPNCTTVVQTRTVHGLSVANNGNYLCSYVDSVIALWDLRSFDKPLSQIQTTKNNVSLAWCPTRASILSSIQRDSPYVHIINIHSADIEHGREIYHSKKHFIPFPPRGYSAHKSYILSDIAWHPEEYEKALVLSETGLMTDFQVPPTISISWNATNKLWRSFGLEMHPVSPTTPPPPIISSTFQMVPEPVSTACDFVIDGFKGLADDISEVIRKRAMNDYGLLTDVKRNGDIAQSANLKTVWQGLAAMNRDERMVGLKTVLGVGTNTASDMFSSSRSEAQILQWPEFINNSNSLTIYRSEQRDNAQDLCGWTFDNDLDQLTNSFVPSLCAKNEFSRAAMICVFHLKIIAACDILSKAATGQSSDPSMFRIAAIALSSFNADRCSSTWRHQRSSANMQIHDAHLRAIFSFLTIEDDNYDSVLNEEGISLADRTAFACRFLNDLKLSEFVKVSITKSVENGDLNGLLLTGESTEGVNLMQSFVDKTEDVQTVSLIAIKFFHPDVFAEYRVQYWITSYLDLLDTWSLWEKRAELEIKMDKIRAVPKTTGTVFLLCNFCGKSVSSSLQEDARARSAASNVNKLSSCPNCRKPLPRCSLCLLHMGTPSGIPGQGEAGHESLGWQSKPFSKWFSWCQTCRHGGHTEHILQWFGQNKECPVAGCSCRCFEVDAPIQKITRESS